MLNAQLQCESRFHHRTLNWFGARTRMDELLVLVQGFVQTAPEQGLGVRT